MPLLRLRPRTILIFFARVFGKSQVLFQDLAKTVYDGIVPPLVGYSGLYEIMELSYGSGRSMYSTKSHNESGLYSWEHRALDDYLAEGKRFMVLAAGAGREVFTLLRRGVQVDAWECNDSLRDLGNRFLKEEALPCQILRMEPDTFPTIPDGRRYDGCIVGWSAYSHILQREHRVALLSRLRPFVDGPVLISFPSKHRPGRLKRFLRRAVAILPGMAKGISLEVSASPGTVCVGFDEAGIAEESAAGGFDLKVYRNHPPEYPYAVLMPRRSPGGNHQNGSP